MGSTRRRVTAWLRRRLAVIGYLVMASGMVWGLWRLEQLVHQEHDEDRVEDAMRCVDAHNRVVELRGVIEGAVRDGSAAGAGAVFDVAIQLLDEPLPEGSDVLLEQAVDRRVRRVVRERVASYPDPTCDLRAARAVLEDR